MQYLTEEQANDFRIYTLKVIPGFEMRYFIHDKSLKFVIYHNAAFEKHLLQIMEIIETKGKMPDHRKLLSLKLEENYSDDFLNRLILEQLKGEDYVDAWGLDQVKCYNYWLLRSYCPKCDYHFVISSVKL
jgi:hypothetical protein